MRICLICVEIFAWGKYGGFGRSTRMLGRELAKRGHEVIAVVPRRADQKPVEELDGMHVLSFPVDQPWLSQVLYQQINADIYHSQEPSMGTYYAMKTSPNSKHVVTFRDPRGLRDWWIEIAHPSKSRLNTFKALLYENNPWVRHAIHRADAHFSCAQGLEEKAQKLYRLKQLPTFLSSPIEIPTHDLEKSIKPQVCFLGRWDKRKRPELFLQLAKERKDVHFVGIGQGQNEKWDKALRAEYGRLENVELLGFVDQFRTNTISEVLSKSWILINTSSREGLPTSFLEAMAHRCALLSSVNTGGITEKFGYWARHDDFLQGLNVLLANDTWKTFADKGRAHVEAHYECERALDQHEAIYQKLLNDS